MATIKVKSQICVFVIVFFVILGPENVYLDTKIIFPSDLETEILRQVYSGGHFTKKLYHKFLYKLSEIVAGRQFSYSIKSDRRCSAG